MMKEAIERFKFISENEFIVETLNDNNYNYITETEIFFKNDLFQLFIMFGENPEILYIDISSICWKSFRHNLYNFINHIKNKEDLIIPKQESPKPQNSYLIKIDTIPEYLINLIDSLVERYNKKGK